MSVTQMPSDSHVIAHTKEITGKTEDVAALLLRVCIRYPKCRITAEPNGGVAIRLER